MFRVTRYPMISKTESGRVSKEIPGSGSGSGTRWTLYASTFQAHMPAIFTGLYILQDISCNSEHNANASVIATTTINIQHA